MTSLMPTYKRLPVTFTRGAGLHLWDSQEKQYLDALAGIAVCNLGHCHPTVANAICQQVTQLVQPSNVCHIEQQEQLADKLVSLTQLQQVFFSNSGAEANEAAIKLARLYGHQRGIEEPTIIVMERAFHGRTLATLTASAGRANQAGFEPLVKGFIRAPFNDIEALQQIAVHEKNIIGVWLEPIQGGGGIQVPDEGYLTAVRELCDQNDWLLMLDEIQTGMGRTGKFMAYQHSAITPDIVTLAKALANGIPIGATIAGEKLRDLLQPGKHGSTFGGNPLACRAALATLDVLEQENLIANATKIGTYLQAQLRDQLAEHDTVIDIRGKGLILGIECKQACRPYMEAALEQGLLFNTAGERVIRLLPALILDQPHADQICQILSKVLLT